MQKLVHAGRTTHLRVHLVGHVSRKVSWAGIPDIVPPHHSSTLVTLIKNWFVIKLIVGYFRCIPAGPGRPGDPL